MSNPDNDVATISPDCPVPIGSYVTAKDRLSGCPVQGVLVALREDTATVKGELSYYICSPDVVLVPDSNVFGSALDHLKEVRKSIAKAGETRERVKAEKMQRKGRLKVLKALLREKAFLKERFARSPSDSYRAAAEACDALRWAIGELE